MDAPAGSAAVEIARLRSRLNELRSVIAHPDLSPNGELPPRVTQLLDGISEMLDRIAQRTKLMPTQIPELRPDATEGTLAEDALREGERIWRVIVDSIPGQVALLKVNGEVDFANREILDYTGRTLEQLKQWGTTDIVHPEDLPQVIEVFTRSVASSSPYEIIERLRRSDGVYRWFHSKAFPLRDPNGQLVRWCVLLNDIDEQKRAEDALRESERESRLIVNTIPGLVATMTSAGHLDVVNNRMLEYFGVSTDEVRRWATNNIIHPDDRPRVIQIFRRVMASGEPHEYEVRLRRFDGVYCWFQLRGHPLRDDTGVISRWYVLLFDIEELKRAEDAVRASQRNLQLIIDTIPALAWSAQADGSVEFFNRHYLDFIGFSGEQARGWGWTAAVHPDDLNGLVTTWQYLLASEAPGEAEARLRRHDGQYRWFLFRANPLRDESGHIVKWYGVNTDIEDRKGGQAELQRAYDHLAEAQRLSQTGSFTSDLARDEHYWSEEFYRICEFEPGSTINIQRLGAIVHPDDLPLYEGAIQRAFAGTEPEFYFRIVTATNVVKHLRGLAHRISDRPIFVGAVQDVTATRVAEDALNKARSELAHVARVATLNTLTASIAHEINQPLSGIITNADACLMMLDANPPNVDGARETVRRTMRDGDRASAVVTRLRALFSKREFTLEPLDLNEATREVMTLSSSDLQRNRVIVQSELADDLPTITGDRIQLQQVILNLIRNASDAMTGVHDRPRQLLVRTEREDGDRVRVTVRDAGTGFDRESTDSLFEAFYTTKSDGMGIGLSVSRSIVERHRGRLWAEPNDGPGATFSFSIPRNPESVAAAATVMGYS